MRFLYGDPYALRVAMEQLAGQPMASRQDRDQPIPVDVYQDGTDIVIEGAVPGVRLEDLEISSEEGMLSIRGTIAAVQRDFAVQEIPRGQFSRTLALPGECDASQARASLDNGVLRIVVPRQRQRTAHSIKVEMATADDGDGSRIVMEKPDVIDAVKGEGYRELRGEPPKRKGRSR